MIIQRPENSPEVFEGIASCFVGSINAADLFPDSATEVISVKVVYESNRPLSDLASINLNPEDVSRAIDMSCDQYAKNIAPESVEERFEDFLLEENGLSVAEAVQIFRDKGISPFLTLELIFVSELLSTISLDFECFGEGYFDEHGFSLDITKTGVELATPRLLMREGSYPASRHQESAEQDVEVKNQRKSD